jgi:hypothetical protein
VISDLWRTTGPALWVVTCMIGIFAEFRYLMRRHTPTISFTFCRKIELISGFCITKALYSHMFYVTLNSVISLKVVRLNTFVMQCAFLKTFKCMWLCKSTLESFVKMVTTGNNSGSIARNFMKFDISLFFSKCVTKIQV